MKGAPILTTSQNKSHTLCRRCGRRSFHIQKSTCSSCGYPAAKVRKCTLSTLRATARKPESDIVSQTTGPRRRRGERPPVPDACVTSRPSPGASKMASSSVRPRVPAAESSPFPHKREKWEQSNFPFLFVFRGFFFFLFPFSFVGEYGGL